MYRLIVALALFSTAAAVGVPSMAEVGEETRRILQGEATYMPTTQTPAPTTNTYVPTTETYAPTAKLPSGVHMLQKFYTDSNWQNLATGFTAVMQPLAPAYQGDPSLLAGECTALASAPGVYEPAGGHSAILTCGPNDCEATIDWIVGNEVCDPTAPERREIETFSLTPGMTDGDFTGCIEIPPTEFACALQIYCSLNMRYHKFPEGVAPYHIHEYCPCG
mmetsp:Transcript_10520/g.31403  ORF Transcript_10520/g.31403 Transcript_10520/m.31403 type:complete len:220 (+) Transcript_10520:72-731(+)